MSFCNYLDQRADSKGIKVGREEVPYTTNTSNTIAFIPISREVGAPAPPPVPPIAHQSALVREAVGGSLEDAHCLDGRLNPSTAIELHPRSVPTVLHAANTSASAPMCDAGDDWT